MHISFFFFPLFDYNIVIKREIMHDVKTEDKTVGGYPIEQRRNTESRCRKLG